MCGIDPGEPTPFQGGPVYWTVAGVETPGLNPRSPFGDKSKPKERLTWRHSDLSLFFRLARLERLLVKEGPRPQGKAWKRQGSQD